MFASCKGIQDSLGFRIPHHGFQIPGSGFQSLSVELGFRIPIASGIQDSLSCIPDSKAQDSYSTSINFLDCRIQIPLHGAILFSYFRPRDVNPENSVSLKCSPMHVYPSAYVGLIYEKTNSLGLNWGGKTLKIKRAICCLVYTILILLSFSLVHFHMGCTCF